jgi:hypothetical protein
MEKWCPADCFEKLIERTLTELTKQGKIIKLGAGRYIKCRRNGAQEDEYLV